MLHPMLSKHFLSTLVGSLAWTTSHDLLVPSEIGDTAVFQRLFVSIDFVASDPNSLEPIPFVQIELIVVLLFG